MTTGLLGNIDFKKLPPAPASSKGPDVLSEKDINRYLGLGRGAEELATAEANDAELERVSREALENLYAPELLAVSEKRSAADENFVTEFADYVAYLRQLGVNNIKQPRPALLAGYIKELVEGGADAKKVKLVLSAAQDAYVTMGAADPTLDDLVVAVASRKPTKPKAAKNNGKAN